MQRPLNSFGLRSHTVSARTPSGAVERSVLAAQCHVDALARQALSLGGLLEGRTVLRDVARPHPLRPICALLSLLPCWKRGYLRRVSASSYSRLADQLRLSNAHPELGHFGVSERASCCFPRWASSGRFPRARNGGNRAGSKQIAVAVGSGGLALWRSRPTATGAAEPSEPPHRLAASLAAHHASTQPPRSLLLGWPRERPLCFFQPSSSVH